jgi:translation initiation factor IF-3
MLRHCVVSMIRGQPQVTQAFRGGGGRGGGRGGRGNRGPVREKKRDAIMNDEIEADEIRVIGEDKEPLGVMSTDEALAMAKDLEVDLILVVPGATPPVCRLIEYSKFNYEKTKAEKDAKKKQRESVIETKELKMRPGTDVHDYQVKVRAAQKFIDKGFRVKLTLQFRGREMEFKEIGREMFDRFVEDLGGMDQVSIEQAAKMQGRQMNMVLSKKQETVVS